MLAVPMQEFRFSCWWLWRSLSFGMWCHALWWIFTELAEKRPAPSFRVEEWAYSIQKEQLEPMFIIQKHFIFILLWFCLATF